MLSRVLLFVFCFKQKTAYEMRISDWSSDVCSSDLVEEAVGRRCVDLAVLHQEHVGTSRLRDQAALVEHEGIVVALGFRRMLGEGAAHVTAGRLGTAGRRLRRGPLHLGAGHANALQAGLRLAIVRHPPLPPGPINLPLL